MQNDEINILKARKIFLPGFLYRLYRCRLRRNEMIGIYLANLCATLRLLRGTPCNCIFLFHREKPGVH